MKHSIREVRNLSPWTRVVASAALLFCVLYLPAFGQTPQPSPSPTPRRPLPKLSNGARGFNAHKAKDAASRLIAVGGGWGGGEDAKPRLKQRSAVGYYKLGQELLNQLEFGKAIGPLEKAVQLNPKYLVAYEALGQAYAYYGVSAWNDATLVNPSAEENDPEVARLREARYRKAIVAFEHARGLAPNKSENHLNLGVLYFNTGQYEKAIVSLEKGMGLKLPNKDLNAPILESTTPGAIHELIGNAHEFLGQSDKAIESYRKAIAADPTSAYSVYKTLGQLHERLGQTDEAIADYAQILDSVVARNPQDIYLEGELLLTVGWLYASKQDYTNAELAFEGAVKAFARELLRFTGFLEHAGKEERASLAKQVEETKAFLIEANYNHGVAQLGLKETAKAVESFKQALAMGPDNINALYNLGYAYAMAGNKDAARTQARRLSSLDKSLADELSKIIDQ